jgi:hypothetical protein
MTINLSQMTLQPPQFGHGAVAAARLPFVAANDSAGLAAAASSLGMSQVAANQFQHPTDGSWAVMNGGRVERGLGTTQFRGVPANLAALPSLPPGAACSAAAVAPSASASSIVSTLVGAGFVESSKSFFAHPDGSWVAVTPDVGVLRGFGQNLLHPTDVPQPAPSRAPRGAAAAQTKGVVDVMTMAQRTPSFEDGFLACAMPGRLDPSQQAAMRPQLVQQGFVESQPGHFEHPTDKSWVSFTAQGTIERGVANERFNRVPVNPTRLGQVNPQGNSFALSVADSKLQNMTFSQVQKSDAALLAAGFTTTGRGVYSHPDGCFIAFTPNQTYLGQNQQIFATPPQSLDMKNAIASRPEHAFFAIAKTGDLKAGAANLAQSLGGLGFAATVPGALYSHSDGSWVALQGTKLFRGVNAEILKDVPKPPPPGSAIKDTSKPPLPDANNWAFWQQNMAIGKLPILSGSQADLATLASLGFAQIGNEWWHPDGSWVNFQVSPPLGWKGYNLGNLPYNNRRPNG